MNHLSPGPVGPETFWIMAAEFRPVAPGFTHHFSTRRLTNGLRIIVMITKESRSPVIAAPLPETTSGTDAVCSGSTGAELPALNPADWSDAARHLTQSAPL